MLKGTATATASKAARNESRFIELLRDRWARESSRALTGRFLRDSLESGSLEFA
jgi:hypothetical protein